MTFRTSTSWRLGPSGRYQHHPDYIRDLASRHGWQIRTMTAERIRREADRWIEGHLYLLVRS